MDAAEPFIGAMANLVLLVTEHRLPSRGVVDFLRIQVPIPDPIVCAPDRERVTLLAIRGANDGIWDWDLNSQEVYYSPRWKAMLGYEEDQIRHSADEWLSRVHPEDIARLRSKIAAHVEGAQPQLEDEH